MYHAEQRGAEQRGTEQLGAEQRGPEQRGEDYLMYPEEPMMYCELTVAEPLMFVDCNALPGTYMEVTDKYDYSEIPVAIAGSSTAAVDVPDPLIRKVKAGMTFLMTGEPVPRRSKLSKRSTKIWAALDQLKIGMDNIRQELEQQEKSSLQHNNTSKTPKPLDLSKFSGNIRRANI